MKIKKYVGASEYEVMNRVKAELGSDAIILSTRMIKQKGLFGFMKKPLIEVIAAYDNESSSRRKSRTDENLMRINKELDDIKKMVAQISLSKNESSSPVHPKVKKYWEKLIENGVEESIATDIFKKLSNQINLEDKDSYSIDRIVKQVIAEYIGDPKPMSLSKDDQKIIFLIGPTGVGKTTTLAKLAAQLVISREYKVGLITSDTYRIAAVEQLSIYSDILRIPLEVIYSEEDMYKTLVVFKDKDVVFVDTTGRNHREISEDDEIFNIINSINNKEIYLLLSINTDFAVLKSILDHYSFIDDYKIIFTKVDETEKMGNILNVKYLTDKPVSYITTGQNVPNDIEIFDKNKFISYLLGEIRNEGSSGKTKENYF